jgi:hypothetical protein
MIRLLLVALAGWAAWRYRSQLKGYVNQLPQVQSKAAEALSNAVGTITKGLHDSEAGRKGQARS